MLPGVFWAWKYWLKKIRNYHNPQRLCIFSVSNCSNISQYMYYSQKESAYFNSKKFIKILKLNQVFVQNFLWQNIQMPRHCVLLMCTKSITHKDLSISAIFFLIILPLKITSSFRMPFYRH